MVSVPAVFVQIGPAKTAELATACTSDGRQGDEGRHVGILFLLGRRNQELNLLRVSGQIGTRSGQLAVLRREPDPVP